MSAPVSYMKPGEDDPSLAKINALLYSNPGEGKTCLWGSGGKDVLIMASDPEGILSARSLGYEFHSIQVTDYEELEEAYEWLKEDKPTQFKWVVWDSLTLFQDRTLIDDIMVEAVDKNPRQEMFVPSKREYFINMNRIGQMVRQLVKLPYNIGISCLADMVPMPGVNTEGTTLMPMVQGKGMASKIAGYCNVVGYMHKRQVPKEGGGTKTVQTIQFQPDARTHAKDRFGCLGKYMDQPTLAKIDASVAQWRTKIKQTQSTKQTQKAS
jgi:hypothetical protein